MRRILIALAALLIPVAAYAIPPGAVPPAGNNTPVTALGAASPRSLQAWQSDVINLKSWAVGDGSTDDGPALSAAIAASNALVNAGKPPKCIYAPAANYFINSAVTAFVGNGCIRGDGPHITSFTLGTAFSGDLFSWSEAWYGGSDKYGPYAEGFTVTGNLSSSNTQNALMFYDRDDLIYVNNVELQSLTGRALGAGILKNTTQAYIRESKFSNVHVANAGATTAPAVEIASACSTACTGTDATNEIDIINLGIYAPFGPGFVLRNSNTAATGVERQIRILGLRIEGSEVTPYAGDLFQIGDTVQAGKVSKVTCVSCELVSPYAGYYAMSLLSPAGGNVIDTINYNGQIISGANTGAGINIASGNHLSFKLSALGSVGTNVTVGAGPLVAGPIEIDGGGAEGFWTYSIDASSVGAVYTPIGRYGSATYGTSTNFVSAQVPTGNVNGGNNRGSAAVDLQTTRYAATQVASGSTATIGGGQNNTSSGADSVIAGGNSNNNGSYRGAITGGYGNTLVQQYERGGGLQTYSTQYGEDVWGSGQLVSQGDAQSSQMVLRASSASTSPVRLTSDGGAASGQNCVNPGFTHARNISILLVGSDYTTSGSYYSWSVPTALLVDGVAANSTTLVLGTPVALSLGSGSGSAVSATADTTNGCLNLTVTPPNSDTWHWVAHVRSAVTQ